MGIDAIRTEVLVVGAGPAGSTAAEFAAKGGAEVLLIERKEEVGVPVACGEFLPSSEEIRKILPEATDVEALFALPENLVSVRTDRMRIFSPSLRGYEFPFKGLSTDRDRFDKHLAAKAEKAGARIITDCSFLSLEGREINTSLGRISADVIIGADGPKSRVGRCLGLPRNEDLYPAVTAQASGNFDPIPAMYFGGVAPGGYAWIIPKSKGANVGVGVGPRFARKRIGDYFSEFVRSLDLDVGRPTGKLVPMSGPVGRTCTDGGLIVGDAAGHVMAVNGGGVPIAMICGRLAGKAAAAYVTRGLPLCSYERSWRSQVEKPLLTAVGTKSLASLCFGSRWRLETAMALLGKRRMGNIIRCRPVLP